MNLNSAFDALAINTAGQCGFIPRHHFEATMICTDCGMAAIDIFVTGLECVPPEVKAVRSWWAHHGVTV